MTTTTEIAPPTPAALVAGQHDRTPDATAPAPASPPEAPRRRLWTVDEFMKMIEVGLVRGRVDLVDGEVIEMPAATGDKHAIARGRVTRWLHDTFPRPYFIRSQETHRFTTTMTREPDAALLAREPRPDDRLHELPLLVVEVSDEFLHYDLTVKRLEYARVGVPD